MHNNITKKLLMKLNNKINNDVNEKVIDFVTIILFSDYY